MWRRKVPEASELRGHREFFERGAVAAARQPQPVVLERHGLEFRADAAKTLEIPLSWRTPVAKLRSQAVGSLRGAHQRGLVDGEQVEQAMQARYGRVGAVDSVVIGQSEHGDV